MPKWFLYLNLATAGKDHRLRRFLYLLSFPVLLFPGHFLASASVISSNPGPGDSFGGSAYAAGLSPATPSLFVGHGQPFTSPADFLFDSVDIPLSLYAGPDIWNANALGLDGIFASIEPNGYWEPDTNTQAASRTNSEPSPWRIPEPGAGILTAGGCLVTLCRLRKDAGRGRG